MQHDSPTVQVIRLGAQDAAAVAILHRLAINTGFLSGLGQRFAERMYGAILSCPLTFGLGLKDEAGQIIGFIICTTNIKQAYRFSILHHGLSMAIPLLHYMCRLSVLRRLWETFRYPSTVGTTLPKAEVLSIAISPTTRGKGAGQILMEAALREFHGRGTKHVKVAVSADNQGANRFYAHCGFGLALTRLHHGLPMNIYTIELGRARVTAPEALAATIALPEPPKSTGSIRLLSTPIVAR